MRNLKKIGSGTGYVHFTQYSGAQKGRNDFVSNFTNKVVSSFLGTTVGTKEEANVAAKL